MTFGIFSVLVFQISVLESYLHICCKINYDKKCENCDNLGPLKQSFTNISSLPKKYSNDLSHFASVCIFFGEDEISAKLRFKRPKLSTFLHF